MALTIFVYLAALDRLVFPEDPVAINFSIRKHCSGFLVAHHPNKNAETRYNIYVDGLADLWEARKKERKSWIPGNRRGHRLVKATREELLVSLAAHEVRHRVQSDCSPKKFSPKSANLVKDKFIKSIIRFEALVLEEDRKTYNKENKSKFFIRGRINRKEFDATVIERLIASKIHRKNAYSLREETASIIKMSAP